MTQRRNDSRMKVCTWSPNQISTIFKILAFVMLLLIANYAGNWILNQLNFQLRPSTEPILHRLIVLAISLYICLMTLPFVPGIEIGLAMMALLGAKIVPLVYIATVAALILGFLIGRFIPQRLILEVLCLIRARRLQNLLMQLEPLDTKKRIDFLLQNTSGRFVQFLLRHRYVALAFALNLPGNAFIGGGGGISFTMGFIRFFTLPEFAITVSLAVLPFPLIVFLKGA